MTMNSAIAHIIHPVLITGISHFVFPLHTLICNGNKHSNRTQVYTTKCIIKFIDTMKKLFVEG